MRKLRKRLNDYLYLIKRRVLWVLVPTVVVGFSMGLLVRTVPDKVGSSVNQTTQQGKTATAAPASPSSAVDRWQLYALGLGLGLIIGVGLAIFFERKKTYIEDESELARHTSIPVLISIPFIENPGLGSSMEDK
jgi:hypothetical protein